MKDVLCVYECWDGIPYFHFKGGERYGPTHGDVCKVVEVLSYGVYGRSGREVLYYVLEGWDHLDSRFVYGRVVFPDFHFVDLVSDAILIEALEEIEELV